jgi:hypothetical protein
MQGLSIAARLCVWALAMAVLTPSAATGQEIAVRGVPWIAQGDDWAAQKQKLQELGEQFSSADALYAHFRQQAGGGTKLAWPDMAKPAYNWAGLWTRAKGRLSYDPDIDAKAFPSAKLTPEGKAVVDAKIKQIKETGGEYDPISDCRPPGMPRWITEPFLKEWVITPDQTWLMNEMVNDIRRVYTDARQHLREDDTYNTPNGDSVGFWDGDILTFQTKYLIAGQYQRGIQPNYSDKVETVERWRKVNDDLVQADVWVFDPVNLAAPWFTRQGWRTVPNKDLKLRINYWDCRENPNNQIIVKQDGTSQFPLFDFVPDNAAASNDPAVKDAAKKTK